MSNQLAPQLSADPTPGQAAAVAAASLAGLRPILDPALAPPPPANATPKGPEDTKDQVLPSAVKAGLLLASASKIEPMKALDSRFTERSKATPGVPAAISSTVGLPPLDR